MSTSLVTTLKWFEYNQNNSGGRFQADENVNHYVYIQAHTSNEANEKAESIGIYFDGAGDCPCCGNRWSEAYRGFDKMPKTYVWSGPNMIETDWALMDEMPEQTDGLWTGKIAVFHFADGSRKYGVPQEIE